MENSAWSDFWSSDQDMCIQGDGSQEVNKLINDVWLAAVTNILKEEMICYDLASGSGYLPKLISQNFSNKKPSIVAYDYAKVNHQHYPSSVKIIDQHPIETISASEKDKADIVMSNFGFEYADIDKAFSSMIEYTHKGTDLLLNCHHQDSIYSKDGKDIISAFKELNSSGLLDRFSKVLLIEAPTERKHKAVMFFQDASTIDKRNGNGLSKMQIVDMFLHFYKTNSNPADNLNSFMEAIIQQKNYITRLEHQLEAAHKYPAIINYLKSKQSLFCVIKEQDITFDGHLISKFITAKIK